MNQKKIPYIYRSLAHFYLIYVLPTSVLTIFFVQLFNEKTFSLDQLKTPGPWIAFLVFQIIFGSCVYFWDYKPRSKKFRENA
ncbi:hypothetical protein LV85_00080 [Algoriphagus chordae]|uniref:Uncharacterized protein n=1 Tax=Algoriphagus chordae TaxID=237019 RepID=A0A2W7RAC6_9BACT|nr:hypothetical protein LV85_00080 [Algoriphagus chordae]